MSSSGKHIVFRCPDEFVRPEIANTEDAEAVIVMAAATVVAVLSLIAIIIVAAVAVSDMARITVMGGLPIGRGKA
ncbi:MAG: hypothetical protein MI753_01390 [Hyphomicrobiales bacterium]|nr:hypothetical protein [Hyphomicrobiales bacterium]